VGGANVSPSKNMKGQMSTTASEGANVHHSKLPSGQMSGYPDEYERLAYEYCWQVRDTWSDIILYIADNELLSNKTWSFSIEILY
jgi:hypothetical protein